MAGLAVACGGAAAAMGRDPFALALTPDRYFLAGGRALGACSGVAVLAEHGPQRLPEPGRSSVA
jgi:hypothetical protein